MKIFKDLFEIVKGNKKREKKWKDWKNYKKFPFFIAIAIAIYLLVNKTPIFNSVIIVDNHKYEQNFEIRFDIKNIFVDTTGDFWTGPTAGVKLQFYNEGIGDPS